MMISEKSFEPPEIVLVNCWKFKKRFKWVEKYHVMGDCLGLGYIAAVLREDGYSVTIIDAYVDRLYPHQIARRIIRKLNDRPFFLGFTSMFPGSVEHAIRVAEQLRRNGFSPIHTTIGGVFASVAHHTILEHFSEIFDSVVCGEGEETARELLRCISEGGDWADIPGLAVRCNGRVKRNPTRGAVDLEKLPWPARDNLHRVIRRGGEPHLSSSRGCGSSCLFCMDRQFYNYLPANRRWHCRAPKDIVDEIEWLVREYDVKRIKFDDENSMGSLMHKDRLMEIGAEMARRELSVSFSLYFRSKDIDFEVLQCLHRVGLASVFLGIESFWQPTLQRFNKGSAVDDNVKALRCIRKVNGLSLFFGIMMYHPWVTMEEIVHNIEMVRQEILGIPLAIPQMIYRLTQTLLVYKGTPLWRLAAREGLITMESRYEGWLCGYRLPELPARHLSMVGNELGDLGPAQVEMSDYLEKSCEGRRAFHLKKNIAEWIERVNRFMVDTSLELARDIQVNRGDGNEKNLVEKARREKSDLLDELRQMKLQSGMREKCISRIIE